MYEEDEAATHAPTLSPLCTPPTTYHALEMLDVSSVVFTVILHDFESITTFSVTVSAGSLGIARPRYQIHRMRGAQVSAKRFCEF